MSNLWKIPVTWEMCGVVEVEAETLEDAVNIVKLDKINTPLPTENHYVDGSFGVTSDDLDELKDMMK